MQKNEYNRTSTVSVPPVSLPRGGGAIKGIEEKFRVNSVTGTSSFSLPLPLSPSRGGYMPEIALNYNSGNGNSPFGLGWDLSVPSISRRTDKKLPEYRDEEESDTFIYSGSEDLVPLLLQQGNKLERYKQQKEAEGNSYTVTRYRPRIENSFARIEKWKDNATGTTFWKTVTGENFHSFYGLTDESRLADPGDKNRVFEWKLCLTHDDKGNITIYKYKHEDFAGIPPKLNETQRSGNASQVYIKEVLYGNKHPYFIGDQIPGDDDFMFRVVFDYGEHSLTDPVRKDVDRQKETWISRKDPFSAFRAGFQIRTYRLCRRILMFHCFDPEDLPVNPCLVRSLQLFYDNETGIPANGQNIPGHSLLARARENGHLWDAAADSYKTAFRPETEIRYQKHEWNTQVHDVTPENRVNAPYGIDNRTYLWVDLFSEGIAGILTGQADHWYYKSNLGNGKFSPMMPVASRPSSGGTANQAISIQDLEGNGSKYLVHNEKDPKGYFKLTDEGEWEPMQTFESYPNINPGDPALHLLDLNGDGRADILASEEDHFRWYPSEGEKGFRVSQTIAASIDEEKGPAVVFSGREQTVFFTDMSGDGLTDIVRIRNGETCYWPNLGYGRFGPRINMDNAPLFDYPDSYNPANLRLADVDGTGTTDLIYLGKNDFRVWMNLNGNEFSPEPVLIPAFPQVDNLSGVAVLDFLGSGTACIVSSSAVSHEPLRYIDLMGGRKPFLFNGYLNNCGKEVTIEYKSSSHFYTEDKIRGNKWITKLPFPVHCISKVKFEDKVSQTVLTTTYRYRHGYYDHEEGEFRGFARVEKYDTEEFEAFRLNDAKNVIEEDLYQPPVKTVLWFHTGAYLQNKKILHQCEDEYFQNTLFNEHVFPEPELPEGLSTEEVREAFRVFKGAQLRTEVYSDDHSGKEDFPYAATQSTFAVRMVQPKGPNRYASFIVLPSESVSYKYEREPADPGISHSFLLEADDMGLPLRTSTVVYPRVKRPAVPGQIPDEVWENQNKLHVVYGEIQYTNDISSDDVHRNRATFETISHELNGIQQPVGFYLSKTELKNAIAGAVEIPFEEDFGAGIRKRRISHNRSYFLKDDLSGPLPLGQLSELALGHKTFLLAFTKNFVSKYYGARVSEQMLTDAKYVHSEGDDNWWIPSGTIVYAQDPRGNFYNPLGMKDPYDLVSSAGYDKYNLVVTKTTDPIGNSTIADMDYRTLAPMQITDPNLNRVAVQTDTLGMVVRSAVMGKAGSADGDSLADPTSAIEYELFNWKNNRKPNYAHISNREKHGNANPRWQESYVYSDGEGDIVLTKSRAAPGKASAWNPATKQVDEVDADPRWVGNGRTIYNNKGNPVKQYEPYFSATEQFEDEAQLVETGVTPVFYYDAAGRNIRTEFPNGTFVKSEFDNWHFTSFDQNDTVKDSRWYTDRGSPDPDNQPEPADPEKRTAWLAAKHHNTPDIVFQDNLGRSFFTINDLGKGKTTRIYSETDLPGRYAKVFDPLGRNISETYTNMAGKPVYGKTAEKGERRIFTDVLDRYIRVWDNDLREMSMSYDDLHRPVSTFLKEGNLEVMLSHHVYGDIFP